MINVIITTMGLVTLGLGVVGVFLPGIPTVPFLLITAFCFSKGSPRFHNWFCSTKIYKKYLSTYILERKMTLKTKLCILLPATTMMAMAFVLSPWWQLRVILSFLCILKYVYFFTCITTISEK